MPLLETGKALPSDTLLGFSSFLTGEVMRTDEGEEVALEGDDDDEIPKNDLLESGDFNGEYGPLNPGVKVAEEEVGNDPRRGV